MTSDVQKYISFCSECNKKKHEPPIKEKKNIILGRPLERLQGDLIHLTPSQAATCNKTYTYIFSVVDYFSKYKWCFTIKKKKGKAIEKFLKSVIATLGHHLFSKLITERN